MKALIIFITSLSAAPAFAHPGHLIGVGGHDHWGAAIAIGLAVGIGLWGSMKGRRKDEEETDNDAEAESGPDEELQEA